ncbi:MAG: 23S rRNA (cytidine(2498)-2'-O)-methyltransferase RlmM [Gammaproteobacteria bacterium]|nr:23S rRNA (cytidine(2498)-2'-O)-methyltransferase RlmM [Gammaproteobacteria bacterium]
MHGLFLHCRAGFESECAAEIQTRAAALDVAGWCRTKPAYVVFVVPQAADAERLQRELSFATLIFARQWFRIVALVNDLDIQDRVRGLVAALADDVPTACGLFLETPDTNAAKELQPLCRKLDRPLRAALQGAGHLSDAPGARTERLHVCLLATVAAYVGVAPIANSSPHPMGIPRLRFPKGAPSRSTLKLEEALLTFLDAQERAALLRPGMRAVDLGAAPGGWTWQLVRRGLRVTAVDNGALAPALLDSGLVEHRREDGFRFRPGEPVDWMVCDIVEQPARVAELAARWLGEGWCRYAVFNLKLPMKKRYQEVEECLARVRARLEATGRPFRLACKQLYHDREEVTVFAASGA